MKTISLLLFAILLTTTLAVGAMADTIYAPPFSFCTFPGYGWPPNWTWPNGFLNVQVVPTCPGDTTAMLFASSGSLPGISEPAGMCTNAGYTVGKIFSDQLPPGGCNIEIYSYFPNGIRGTITSQFCLTYFECLQPGFVNYKGYTWYKQVQQPWRLILYGGHDGEHEDIYYYTIGCYLTSLLNLLNSYADADHQQTPAQANDWLCVHNGFARSWNKRTKSWGPYVNVDIAKVAQFAHDSMGLDMGWYSSKRGGGSGKTIVPINGISTILMAGLRCIASVKNAHHWVLIVCFWDDGTIDYYIFDPSNHWLSFYQYAGANDSDIRSLYLRQPKKPDNKPSLLLQSQSVKRASISVKTSAKTTSASADLNVPIAVGQSFGQSAFIAHAGPENLTLRLYRGSELVDESYLNEIADNETDEVLYADAAIEDCSLASGNYTLKVSGTAGEEFHVAYRLYDYDGNSSGEQEADGILNANGETQITFVYQANQSDFADLTLLPTGQTVNVFDGIATANVPGGFMIQPKVNRIPAYFVEWPVPIAVGSEIDQITGTVMNGRVISATAVYLSDNEGIPIWPAAFCVSPAGASGTFGTYIKVPGTITQVLSSTTVILDNCLSVDLTNSYWPDNPNTPIRVDSTYLGSTITVNGVCRDGLLYGNGDFTLPYRKK